MQEDHPLDNPIGASLASRHAALALQHGVVVRYPADIAPFLAVQRAGLQVPADLAALVSAGETVYGVGPAPAPPPGWTAPPPVMLAQMVYARTLPVPPGAEVVELGAPQQRDIHALAARVYPHYFRPRTPVLGRYFGIYQDGRLAAMIGERMGTLEWREVSAVCADPDFSGRGHARRLLLWLGNDLLDRGQTPFLHVSLGNTRALELYRRNGYATRREVAHWSLARPDG